tara:strand:+ start:1132 stop:1506 length:375 start_codon:yes stop_codon:yes gene_type:complete
MKDRLVKNPEDWLIEFFYNANKPDFETFRVYKTYSRYISDLRQFVGTLEYVTPTTLRIKPQTDLADDCLFGVTFFKNTIRRKGLSVKHCERLGKCAFESIGYPTISQNWGFWVNYVGNNLVVDK